MFNGFSEEKISDLLALYLTPSQTISHQERLHGRQPQLDSIRRALRSPGRHVFIYGDRGVGKTSLAKTAAFIAQPTDQPLALIACNQAGAFSDFVQDIAKKLYPDGVTIDRYSETTSRKLSLGPVEVGKTKSLEKGVIPPVVTINDAVNLIDAVAERYSYEPVVIIDEFDQLDNPDDMKLFADLIKQVSDQEIGIRFIFCGIGASLEELIGVHLSTDRYLTPIELEPLKHEARWAILEEAAKAFEIEIDQETIMRIGHISDGFPYYVHLIGEELIWAMHEEKTETLSSTVELFHTAVTRAIETSYTSLKTAYNVAIRKYKNSDQFEEVLWAIADGKNFVRPTEEIYNDSYIPIMRKLDKNPLERNTFSQRMNSLKRDGHGKIIQSPRRSWFTFSENIVRGYVRLRAEKAGIFFGPDHHFGKSELKR